MKAILVSEFIANPALLEPIQVPQPIPQSDQFLVRITHCSPQHADILHAQGKHQNNNAKRGWCFPPFILGYDFAGVVESVPTNMTTHSSSSSPFPSQNSTSRARSPSPYSSSSLSRSPSSSIIFQRGDRVFGSHIGSFAQFLCVPSTSLHHVPRSVSLQSACALASQTVSYAAIAHVAQVRAGETVLVSGASGGLGSGACLVAKALGARVIALTGDATKAELLKQRMGMDEVVVLDDEGTWIRRVLELTDGRGVDVAIDNIGIVNDAIRASAFGARIVIVGFAARKGVMESVKMNALLLKGITLMGYRFGERGRRFPDEMKKIWDEYLGLMEGGRLTPVLYGEYRGLESVGRALGDLMERKVYGKIVISIADEDERMGARL